MASGVLWVGGTLLWGNIQDLMDRQADPELLDAVRDEALAVEGVLGVETLRVRKVGLEYLVDIHVEVDPDHSVRDGHAIAHAVKDRVIGRLVPIRDVLVHVEPSPPDGTARSADYRGPGRPGLVLAEVGRVGRVDRPLPTPGPNGIGGHPPPGERADGVARRR